MYPDLSKVLTGRPNGLLGAECELHRRSVNWWISVCEPFGQHSKPAVIDGQEVRLATRRLITKIKAAAVMMRAGMSPTRA